MQPRNRTDPVIVRGPSGRWYPENRLRQERSVTDYSFVADGAEETNTMSKERA